MYLSQRTLRRAARRFWGTLFTLVIASAVIVQMGREAFPLLNDYRDDIGRLIGERLGVHITISQLSASWSGLRPKVELFDLAIDSEQGEPIFRISQATAELGLVDSLVNGQLSWRRLLFKDLRATLVQKAEGPWRIKNLQTQQKGPRNFPIEDPLDIFLVGNRVEISNAIFDLEFRTGHRSSVEIPDILLENDGDFHRLKASAAVEGEQHFTLITEGYGDPRDPDTFDAVGYVSLNQFPMERVLAAFAGDWWREQESQQWAEGHRMDLELWYRGTSTTGMTLRGSLRADGLPLDVPDDVSLPAGVHSDITGRWLPRDGWQLSLQNLIVDWPDRSSLPLSVALHAKPGQPLAMGVAELQLQSWHQLLADTGILRGKVGRIMGRLKPAGRLTNVDIQLTGKEQGYFTLKANLDQVSLDSFRGAPALTGINGYISTTAFDGYANVLNQSGFSMDFPDIYHQPFHFDEARGQVSWHVDRASNTAYIATSRMDVMQGEQASFGYLYLDLPLVDDPREPQMTLAVGLEKGPVSLHKTFVPKIIPDNLYQWLGKSIGSGTATDVAFMFHGSVDKNAKVPPNLQLMANVHNGELAFDDHWPPLKEVYGRLVLDDRHLDVQVSSATLLGNQVNNAEIELIDNPDDEGVALAIKGALSSNAAAAMELLQNSPVKQVFGSTFDSWKFGGDVSAQIELQVPLHDNAKGMHQLVSVEFANARVDMVDIGLAVDKVHGSLNYDSELGLLSPGLKGEVWGREIDASIESPRISEQKNETRRNTLIHFSGPVDVADVRRWTQRPELGFVEGSSQVAGTITIPAADSTEHYLAIDLESELQGVTLNLPSPMTKPASEKRPFGVNLKLFDEHMLYRFDYNREVSLRLRSGVDDSVQLNFGDSELPLQPGFFDVLGKVSSADLLEWDLVREKYFEFVAQLGEGAAEEAAMPIRVNMDIGRATIGDPGVDNVHVNGLGTEDLWELRVESEPVAGDILIRADDSPVSLHLDYLRLPDVAAMEQSFTSEDQPPDHEKEKTVPEAGTAAQPNTPRRSMADVDISTLTSVDFYVSELTVGDEPYGRWAFNLRPIEDGIAIRDVHANIRGMAIGEAVTLDAPAPPEAPKRRTGRYGSRGDNKPKLAAHEALMQELLANPHAEFIWRQTDEGNVSSFSGTLMARDAGALLEAWGQEKIIESKLGVVQAEVSWPGAPDQIDLQNVSGKVIFNFVDGSFIRGATEGENGLLRLIALFNFDTIARRLRLDFSDLAKEGFGFDTVHGNFDFENGWIYINEPLVVNSTSSKLQVAGTLDVIEEKIDAELVATLPVAGDITVAAALIAGLPAAIGVFLVSQIFEEQVDQASSINYRITGDWEDPKIKFRKIFDDSAAEKKAREVESMDREEQRRESPEQPGSDDRQAVEQEPSDSPDHPPVKYD